MALRKSQIMEPLGIYGMNDLEPVILASLATEYPLLLAGQSGTAKSYFLERLAQALDLKFRHYNASLINYDDLVGIPVPDEDKTALHYITSPESIWDAQVVFIDEINRTKPELQNKLFPIIYDKMIEGKKLTQLRYRWAAMNPPDFDNEDDEDPYSGIMPLDPALADRFAFIVHVPSWNDLTVETQEQVMNSPEHDPMSSYWTLKALIAQTQNQMNQMKGDKTLMDKISSYSIVITNLLNNSLGYVSTRRAVVFKNTLIAMLAASKVLGQDSKTPMTFEEVTALHIKNTLPLAIQMKVDDSKLSALALQANKQLSNDDTLERNILLLDNPLKRIINVIKFSDYLRASTVSDVITQNIGEIEQPLRRAVATVAYAALRTNEKLFATAFETLKKEVEAVLSTNLPWTELNDRTRKVSEAIDRITLSHKDKTCHRYDYEKGLLYSFIRDTSYEEKDVNRLDYFYTTLCDEVGFR